MLIYSWIEKFRNLEKQEIKLARGFNVKIIDKGTDKKVVEIVNLDKTCVKQIQASFLVGENAAGKTNILDCLSGNFKREESKYFNIYYDVQNDNFDLLSFGLDVELSVGEKKLYAKEDEAAYHQNFKKIPRSLYFARSDKFSSPLTRPLTILGMNIKKESIFGDIYSLFLDNNFKVNYEKKFNNIGKFVIGLEHGVKFSDKYFTKSYKVDSVFYKELFIRFFCEKCFGKITNHLFRMESISVPEIGESPRRWQTYEEYKFIEIKMHDFRFTLNHDKLLVNDNRIGIVQIENTAKILAKYISDIKCDENRKINDPNKQFIDLFLETLYELINLDEKYFVAIFKIELDINNDHACLIKCIDTLERCRWQWIKFNKEIEWLSTGEEQFLKFSALLKQNNNYNKLKNEEVIFFIDEPEMSLNPVVSLEMKSLMEDALEYFVSKGKFKEYQIVIATHSPYIIKSFYSYGMTEICNFCMIKRENQRTTVKNVISSDFKTVSHPISFGQILYNVFNMPSVDFHIELYNKLYSREEQETLSAGKGQYSIRDFDKFLSTKVFCINEPYKPSNWDECKKGYMVTMPTLIRHQIDHGNNQYETVEYSIEHVKHKNRLYTHADLRKSIEDMYELI